MFRGTIFLLAFSVVLTSATASPEIVNGFKYQCQARGPYVGACSALDNVVNGGFACNNLVCAKYISENVYEGVPTGPALDYTECGINKLCKRGSCKRVGRNKVPFQLGPGLEYICKSPVQPAPVKRPKVQKRIPEKMVQSKKNLPSPGA
ncbi:uncharacterized protein [Venturia canescens]|uniref:uncharacterized protein n=1 Tax=Venturia canescens TaxID=32260 RepID=UPI001C9C4B75|nr:uncharacterized protein LOC122410808 [Venturia canescens]